MKTLRKEELGKIFKTLSVLPYKKDGRSCQIMISANKVVGFADADCKLTKSTLVYQGQDGLWRPASVAAKLW